MHANDHGQLRAHQRTQTRKRHRFAYMVAHPHTSAHLVGIRMSEREGEVQEKWEVGEGHKGERDRRDGDS
eukprot:3655885-Pleurochrysis_carterae.AAC.2